MIDPRLPAVTPRSVPQPAGVPWPGSTWPTGSTSPAVEAVIDEAFGDPSLAETLAVVVVVGGRLVTERYAGAKVHFDRPAEPVGPETELLGWSMAKSLTHLLVGQLVDEGRLDPAAPAGFAEWSAPGDPRADITVEHLLQMRDGLFYNEDYVDEQASDTIEMLFGSAKADMSAFAADRPLAHPPGQVFNYSSGTTLLLARLVADRLGRGDALADAIRQRVFAPLAMASGRVGLDEAGVFVGSSFFYATARDFARFGLLYLRGGEFDGRRIVSPAWTHGAQVPLSVDEDGTFYSRQWWVTGDRFGTYWAAGYEGQSISVVPGLDAVIVRLGRTEAARGPLLRQWRGRLLEAIAG